MLQVASCKMRQARWIPNPLIEAWDANAGGDNVTTYKLYYGDAPDTYNGAQSPITLGLVTIFKLSIPASKTYYAVTAVNANGESAKSNEIHSP